MKRGVKVLERMLSERRGQDPINRGLEAKVVARRKQGIADLGKREGKGSSTGRTRKGDEMKSDLALLIGKKLYHTKGGREKG